MATPTWVIFINGSYGTGKSSTLDHVGDVLAEGGQPFSLMDVDWFHRSWPPASDDPNNVTAEAANLTAIWKTYQQAGPRQPVVAGVVVSEQQRQRYEAVFDLPVRAVRLTASDAVLDSRLRNRYTEFQQSALDWHLRRYGELSDQLARADLDELVIDTDGRHPRSVAEALVGHFGLLGTLPGPGCGPL